MEFKKFIKSFKANFLLVSLVFYLLGFIYYWVFYLQFGISIFSYLDLKDILFTSLSYLLVLLILYFISEFLLLTFSYGVFNFWFTLRYKEKVNRRLGKSARVKRYLEYKNNKLFNDEYFLISNLVLLTIAILLFFQFNSRFMFLLFMTTFFILRFFFLIYAGLDRKSEREQTLNFGLITFSFLLILLAVGWGVTYGFNIKEGKSNEKLEFYENGVLYSTKTDSLDFIGETSSHLFLYDLKNRETLVFSKSAISKLVIEDNSLFEKLKVFEKLNQNKERK